MCDIDTLVFLLTHSFSETRLETKDGYTPKAAALAPKIIAEFRKRQDAFFTQHPEQYMRALAEVLDQTIDAKDVPVVGLGSREAGSIQFGDLRDLLASSDSEAEPETLAQPAKPKAKAPRRKKETTVEVEVESAPEPEAPSDGLSKVAKVKEATKRRGRPAVKKESEDVVEA
jgi:hypothetical protein